MLQERIRRPNHRCDPFGLALHSHADGGIELMANDPVRLNTSGMLTQGERRRQRSPANIDFLR